MTYTARFLAGRTHQVTVICPAPNYPEGKIYEGWKNQLFKRMTDNNVHVLRTWIVPDRGRSFLKRLLHYSSFMITGFFAALAQKRPEIIVVSSPPLFIGLSGALLSKIWRVPFVFDVRDVWPESAAAVGIMKKGLFFRVAEGLERRIYRAAARITVTSQGIEKAIVAKGISQSKISFIPNGAELDFFYPADEMGRARLKNEYWLTNKFVVLYGGNVGLAQNTEILIRCAHILRDKKDIVFLMVGGGVIRESIEAQAKKKGLENIRFLGQVSRDEMKKVYGLSDAGLILYKKSDVFANVLPGKLFDLWAAGLPIIINLKGEAGDLITRARSGVVVAGEDPQALCEAILHLWKNPEKREEMGKNGRKFAERYFDREKISAQFEKILLEVKSELLK